MQTLLNLRTGQSVEWAGTLDEFNAASDADQVGQWVAEAVAEAIPPVLAPAPAAEVTQ